MSSRRIFRSHGSRRKANSLPWRRQRPADFQPLEERQMLSITVNDFALLHDSGLSATDGITSNATLTGSAVYSGYSGNFLVQFDLDDDSIPDDQRTTAGSFDYLPFGLSYGSHT